MLQHFSVGTKLAHPKELDDDGFAIVKAVFSRLEVSQLLAEIESGIANGSANIKSSLGQTYAARNLAQEVPELLHRWEKPELIELLSSVLGEQFGLVRILYFDKHPERTWSLPWHKDMTIAVKNGALPTDHFSKPTRKSGVDHVEASIELLESMLTLRIHLDDVTEENGPLEVARGSHKNGKQAVEENEIVKILVDAGDVLAMRPLLSHASGSSSEGTTRHRRILHLEFAGEPILPDAFEWHLFEMANRSADG